MEALCLAEFEADAQHENLYAGLWRWRVINLLRMFVGLVTFGVSFLVVVQQDSVLGIFMDFAAVEFVDSIDNAAFVLAAKGYFGTVIQERASHVGGIRFPESKK